jgi:fused signal recognition particle receptor
MFGFFRDALKKTLGKFSKSVQEEATVEKVEEQKPEPLELAEMAVSQKKETIIKKEKTPIQKEKKPEPKPSEHEEPLVSQKKEIRKEKLSSEPVEEKKTAFVPVEDIIEEKAVDKKEEYVDYATIAPKEEPSPQPEPKKKGFFAKLFGAQREKEELNEAIEHDLEREVEENILEGENASKAMEDHSVISKPSDEVSAQTEVIEAEIEEFEEAEKLEIEEQKYKTERKKKHEEKITLLKKEHEHKHEVHEEHKGLFGKIADVFTKITLKEDKFEELFWDLEIIMLENNVAVEVIEKIKADLKKELTQGKVSRYSVEKIISETLRESIEQLFDVEQKDIFLDIQAKKKTGEPYIIVMIGVNGSGKTTSMAKLAHLLQKKGYSCVMAASDTFRAAAINQLEEHANRLNIKLIKHDYHADPAAVAYDAIVHAKAKKIDVVLIDTAGRMHSNANLIEELKKLVRVNKPDLKIFVGESITGNDCVEQAKEFDKAVGIDAIIITKADVDDKGGAAISVSYVTKKPILYLGNGQTYGDLTPFDPKIIVENLGLA